MFFLAEIENYQIYLNGRRKTSLLERARIAYTLYSFENNLIAYRHLMCNLSSRQTSLADVVFVRQLKVNETLMKTS